MKVHWLATASVLVYDPRIAADRTFPAGARFDRVTFNGGNVLAFVGPLHYLIYPASWSRVAPAGPKRRTA